MLQEHNCRPNRTKTLVVHVCKPGSAYIYKVCSTLTVHFTTTRMWGPNEAHLSMIPWSVLSSGSFAMMFKVTSIESCFNLFCPRRTCWSWGAGNFKGRVIILHNFAISSQRLRHAQRLGMTAHIQRDSFGSYIGKVSLSGWGWDNTSCDSFRQPYKT